MPSSGQVPRAPCPHRLPRPDRLPRPHHPAHHPARHGECAGRLVAGFAGLSAIALLIAIHATGAGHHG